MQPCNDLEKRIFVEEEWIFDVQYAIQSIMNSKCITVETLAERLGKPVKTVESYFDTNGGDLTLRDIGEIFFVLGVKAELKFVSPDDKVIH